jgi:hypothetical protein
MTYSEEKKPSSKRSSTSYQNRRGEASSERDRYSTEAEATTERLSTQGTEAPETIQKSRSRASSLLLPSNLKFSSKAPFYKPVGEVEPQQVEDVENNEIILVSEPGDTNKLSLSNFRKQVAKIIEGWGLDFDTSDVKLKRILLDSEERRAVILTWKTSWGTKPRSKNIPPSLSPIDARVSVTAVHKLKGWSELDNSNKTILDNILSGETNTFSQRFRNHLRGKLYGMMKSSDGNLEKKLSELIVKQGTLKTTLSILKELITKKGAIAYQFEEPIETPQVEYNLVKKQDHNDYYFNNDIVADAEFWQMIDKKKPKVIARIFAPKTPNPKYHNHTVEEIADAFSYLPEAASEHIFRVILNPVPDTEEKKWLPKYKVPTLAYMDATSRQAGIVNIYPAYKIQPQQRDSENYARVTLLHEFGHAWSMRKWGEDENKGKWKDWNNKMSADKVSISGYAKKDIHEDLAETFAAYLGTRGTPRFEEYRKIVPNRFEMLDKEYSGLMSSDESENIPALNRDPNGLYINQTTGDGNCFFHAIHECLNNKPSTNSDQIAIRKTVANQLVHNPNVRGTLFGQENPDPERINAVVAELGEGAWTHDYTAGYAAEALNLTIHIYNLDGSHRYTAAPTNSSGSTQTIYMTYTGNHFNSHTQVPLANA